jgi:hydrogenase nickel incorporation protein HypA/HybF
MHELSIVESIIELATKEALAANGTHIESIELDIGTLSGIEMNAFWFAWQHATPQTLLADAQTNINSIEGKAACLVCNTPFGISHYADPCPQCGSHFIQIQQGKELRVRAITIN